MPSLLTSARPVFLAVAAAAVLLLIETAPALAASDAGWEVATVDGAHGADRANYDFSADPGEVIDDSIHVSNTGDDDITIELHPADGFTNRAGEFDLRTRDAESSSVGAWVALATDTVTVRPGESADVPFRITVPANARGEYLGGIVTADASATGEQRRDAIRVRLHVGAAFRPDLTVHDVQVDYAAALFGAGSATVAYTVRNSGDTVISSEQSVSVAGPFGLAARKTEDFQSTPRLLPGESWRMIARIDGVPPLTALTATVSAVPLYIDAAGSTGPLPAVERSGSGWAMPWTVLGILLLVAALLIWWLRRRRARAAMTGTDSIAE